MAYIARRRMVLAGVTHNPGDTISPEVLEGIPVGRLGSLQRVGHIDLAPDINSLEGHSRPKRKSTTPAELTVVPGDAEDQPEDVDEGAEEDAE